MGKTGDISHSGSGSLNITGKVWGRLVYGLKEEDVRVMLQELREQFFDKLSLTEASIVNSLSDSLTEIFNSKIVGLVCNIKNDDRLKKAEIEKQIANNFESLKSDISRKNSLVEEVVSDVKGIAYKTENLSQDLSALTEAVMKLVARYDWQTGENFPRMINELFDSGEKELKLGLDSLKKADFQSAEEHFNLVIENNAAKECKARAYFWRALARKKVQPVWDYACDKVLPVCNEYGTGFYDVKNNSVNADIISALEWAGDDSALKEDFKSLAVEIENTAHECFKLQNESNRGGKYNKYACDCFICVKVSATADDKDSEKVFDSDENEWKTKDWEWLKDSNVYKALNDAGIRTFYSEENLKGVDDGSCEYNARLTYALSTAKVMLLVCSKESYLKTPWVENEYSRFLRLLKEREQLPNKFLIVFNGEPPCLPAKYGVHSIDDFNRAKGSVGELVSKVRRKIDSGARYVEPNKKYCPNPVCLAYKENLGFGFNSVSCSCGTQLVDAVTFLNNKMSAEIEKSKIIQEQFNAEIKDKLKERAEAAERQQAELKWEMYKKTQEEEKRAEGLQKELGKAKVEIQRARDAQSASDRKRADIEKKLRAYGVAFAALRADERKYREAFETSLKRLESDIAGIDATVSEASVIQSKPKTEPAVTSHGDFDIEDGVLVKYNGAGGDVVIPDIVTDIGYNVFYNCRELTSIEISEGLTSIGESAFEGCSGLTNIVIPEGVTEIGKRAFCDCSGLTSIEIPNSVKCIEYCTFAGCSGLTYIKIPNSVTSIGYGALADCSGLKSIEIPEGVTSIGESAFEGCNGLEKISFGGTIEQWNAIERGEDWNKDTGEYTVCCTDGTLSKSIDELIVEAVQGYVVAQFNLGCCYYVGNGVEKNAVEAVKWYKKAAEQNDADAQFNLGWFYEHGEGVEKNAVEAVKWYKKAAAQNHARAQCDLGWFYEHGEGVEKNPVEAVKWFKKSAEQNDARAQCNLGCCYYNGEGVEKNLVEAVKWFKKAAAQNYADAQCYLGESYRDGEGIKKSIRQAKIWFKKAADQGDERAKENLKNL